MKRTLTTTAIAAAILAGAVSSSFAMTPITHPVEAKLSQMGYSSDVISQLTTSELHSIAGAIQGGSYSDKEASVRSLVLQFTK